jgi:excisionase family DNA binding protein
MSERLPRAAPTAADSPRKAVERAVFRCPRCGHVETEPDRARGEGPPEVKDASAWAQKALAGLPAEMTTTQAAEFLDVSRPFVVKLIRRRELPCRMVGKHRRIPTAALVAYREKMFQVAKSAADDMTQLSQELGPYEHEGPPKP